MEIHRGIDLVLSNYTGEKPLMEFTPEELYYFPINYLRRYAKSTELLSIWDNLPEKFKKELEMELPCLGHESSSLEFDGPPVRRKNCIFCNKDI